MPSARIRQLCSVVLTFVSACASPGNEQALDLGPTPGSSRSVVTSEELARAGEGQTLLAALQRVRPTFLTGRGSTPMVSIDDSPPTEIGVLATISAVQVREVQMRRAIDGNARAASRANGDLVVGDLLVVYTRRR